VKQSVELLAVAITKKDATTIGARDFVKKTNFVYQLED